MMWREPYIIRKVASKAAFVLNLRRSPVYPREIWIEPTTRCNIRCITCEKYLKPPGLDFDMEPDVYERVKKQILPYVYRANLIGLGEPLFAPLFPQMVEDCINAGVRFGYTTNGVLLTAELVEKTIKYGCNITLSIDGATKETFESIRRGLKFETLMEKVDLIRSALKKNKPAKFEYYWNFVAMKRNIAELPELVKMAGENGVTVLTVLNFGTTGRDDEIARETLTRHPQLAKKYFAQAQKIAEQYNMLLILPEYDFSAENQLSQNIDGLKHNTHPGTPQSMWALPEGEKFPIPYRQRCYSPWYQVYIRVNGDIWPCCMYSTYSLGNLKKMDFSAIWNGKIYQQFRERIHSGNPPYWCAHCNVPWGITGGDELFFYKLMSSETITPI
ncbi:SPASM domain-containing protein [Candidatus Sumerlaeota bacterium]|nr:SPASM domain-containing protein [Candidatus Sumerlaeota bacterium]